MLIALRASVSSSCWLSATRSAAVEYWLWFHAPSLGLGRAAGSIPDERRNLSAPCRQLPSLLGGDVVQQGDRMIANGPPQMIDPVGLRRPAAGEELAFSRQRHCCGEAVKAPITATFRRCCRCDWRAVTQPVGPTGDRYGQNDRYGQKIFRRETPASSSAATFF